MVQESLEALPVENMVSMAFQLHNLVSIFIFNQTKTALIIFAFVLWVLNLMPSFNLRFIEHFHDAIRLLLAISFLFPIFAGLTHNQTKNKGNI